MLLFNVAMKQSSAALLSLLLTGVAGFYCAGAWAQDAMSQVPEGGNELRTCEEIMGNASLEGTATCVFENGDRYEGEFQSGQLSGAGRYVYAAGGVYEGTMKSGQFEGEGIFVSAAGDRYEGGFQAGRFHGRGVYVTAGGDRYEGQFQNNTFHGTGTYTYADGRQLTGQWENGQLQQAATPEPDPQPTTQTIPDREPSSDGRESNPPVPTEAEEVGRPTGEPTGEPARDQTAAEVPASSAIPSETAPDSRKN